MTTKELKELIDEQGIRYSFIAKSIGFSKPALSNWLNGVSKMPENRKDQIIELITKRNKDNPVQDFRYPFDVIDAEKNYIVVFNEKKKALKSINVSDKDLLSSDFVVINYMSQLQATAFIMYISSCVKPKDYTLTNIIKKVGVFSSVVESVNASLRK